MSSVGDFANKVYETLGALLEDLSSLEVTTSTVDPTGKATVRARTKVAADGDTDFQIPVDQKGEIDSAMLAQHQAAVTQARSERKAMWDQIIKLVSGAIDVEKVEAQQP